MKRHSIAGGVLLGAIAAATPATAFEFAGEARIVSDYRFRGISLSDADPAPQADITWLSDHGFYAGLWGSSLAVGSEIDAYVGYSKVFENDTFFEIGLTHFDDTASPDRDFDEGHIRFGYTAEWFGDLTLHYAYSPDMRNESDQAHYLSLDFSKTNQVNDELLTGFRIGGGRQLVEDNAKFGLPDYWEWQVGAWVEYRGLVVSVDYHDTDIKAAECDDDICGDTVVFGIGKTF